MLLLWTLLLLPKKMPLTSYTSMFKGWTLGIGRGALGIMWSDDITSDFCSRRGSMSPLSISIRYRYKILLSKILAILISFTSVLFGLTHIVYYRQQVV